MALFREGGIRNPGMWQIGADQHQITSFKLGRIVTDQSRSPAFDHVANLNLRMVMPVETEPRWNDPITQKGIAVRIGQMLEARIIIEGIFATHVKK